MSRSASAGTCSDRESRTSFCREPYPLCGPGCKYHARVCARSSIAKESETVFLLRRGGPPAAPLSASGSTFARMRFADDQLGTGSGRNNRGKADIEPAQGVCDRANQRSHRVSTGGHRKLVLHCAVCFCETGGCAECKDRSFCVERNQDASVWGYSVAVQDRPRGL